MKAQDIDRYLIREISTIRDCMRIIEANKQGIALVIDEKGRLKGTVTDGDIRRFILAGSSLDENVTNVMWNKPLTATRDMSIKEIKELMESNMIRNIPIIDEKGCPCKVINLKDIISEEHLLTAVVMAGGEGKRLRPITDKIPKPMIKIGGKPILENIIRQLADENIKNIYISINYKAHIIEEYFKDGADFGVRVSYIKENAKLGTAGSLALLPELPASPIIVVNGDVVTKINFPRLIEFHKQHRCVMTIAATQYTINIPYGVFKLSGYFLLGIEEKPDKSFFCNAGIYVLNPEIIPLIPKNKEFNMTDLIGMLIKKGLPITAFPLHEYWIDIGQKSDLEKAQNYVKDIDE